jgi:hypothetical protein
MEHFRQPKIKIVTVEKPVEIAAPYVTLNMLYNRALQNGLPDSIAELMCKVAVAESGWHLQSELAVDSANYFGMKSNICTNVYAKFDNWQHAVDSWACWADINPPKSGESPISWLERRNYNPYKPYYYFVNSITLPKNQQ